MLKGIRFAVVTLFPALSVVQGQVLYDVTFAEPDHHVGQPASVSAVSNSAMPSSLQFGTSAVVDQVAGHSGVLQLLPVNVGLGNALQYSQYGFNTAGVPAYRFMRVSFDLFVGSMAAPASGTYASGPDDGFTLIFDSPSVTRLDFIGGGRILENSHDIGGYGMGQWTAMTVDIDLALNRWSIYRNGVLLTTTQFFYPYPAEPGLPTAIGNIRLNLSDNQPNPLTPQLYLDNVMIATSQTDFAAIPEPAVSAAAAGLLGLVVVWYRRRSGARR